MILRSPADWFQVAHWLAAQRTILALAPKDAVPRICERFEVSRATGYRWLKAWREAHPTTEGDAP